MMDKETAMHIKIQLENKFGMSIYSLIAEELKSQEKYESLGSIDDNFRLFAKQEGRHRNFLSKIAKKTL